MMERHNVEFEATQLFDDVRIVQRCPVCQIEVAGLKQCPNDGTTLMPEIVPGFKIADRYEIIEKIGAGGMSVIYKAKHPSLDKIVAVKLMHMHLVVNFNSLKRFQHEAQAVSQLSHANIISVHDFGILTHGQPFMVVDYVEGGSLADLIERDGKLEPDLALQYFRQACQAFAYAHKKGILHRDIKPSNIMLDIDDSGKGSVKIVDFGIAQINSDNEQQSRITRTGEIIGTPLYMSPEQCTGSKVDARSDIYSMGCVMYEALSGKPPLQGENLLETMFMHLNADVDSLGTISGETSEHDLELLASLEPVILKCLQKSPSSRFSTMGELTETIDLVSKFGQPPVKRSYMVPSLIIAATIICLSLLWLISTHTNVVPEEKPPLPVASVSKTQSPADVPRPEPPAQMATKLNHGKVFGADGWIESLARNHKPAGVIIIPGTSLSDRGMAWMRLLHDNYKLIIGKTYITDVGMQNLMELRDLRELDIGGTVVTDKGVRCLMPLKSLSQLGLSDTKISDLAITYLQKLPSLQILDLSGTRLSEQGLLRISAIKTLGELDLSRMHVSAKALRALSSMPKLTHLSLKGDGLTATEVGALVNSASSITFLDLSNNNIDDAVIAKLKLLKKLKYLQVESSGINDEQIADLRDLPLEALWIGGCAIEDAGMKSISQMHKLRVLSLKSTEISIGALAHLKSLRDLEDLDLAHTNVDDEGLRLILHNNRKLSTLILSKTNVSDHGMPYIAGLPKMRRLDLDSTAIGDRGLMHLLLMPVLEELSIMNTRVTESGLLSLLQVRSLRHVEASPKTLSDSTRERMRSLLPR